MSVPRRFAIEYPQRALQLIRVFEDQARDQDLIGSFGLLAAASVLTIPYERMKATHFMHREKRDTDLATQIAKLSKVKFLKAPFWSAAPGAWRQSRIMGSVEYVEDWRDEFGRASLSEASNTIENRKAEEVIRVLRNALAHGNIIYLDKNDKEIVGNRMMSIAFLSRYEESKEQRQKSVSYRVVVTTGDEFLSFVKAWAGWVSSFSLDATILEAA